MSKRETVKRTIRVINVFYGVYGLFLMYLGLNFVFMGMRDRDLPSTFAMALIAFLLGVILVAIAWQAVYRFGEKAVKNSVGLYALTLLSVLHFSSKNFWALIGRPFQDFAFAPGLGYIILCFIAYVFYRYLSKTLLRAIKN